MLDEQMKKEILEDTFNNKRNQAFARADEMAKEFERSHWSKMDVDQIIKFLMDIQEVTGPFPLSKEILNPPFNFKL